ncbi:unnamed protein product [Euphydryas editha]|uniref:Uncharacterized protein n=1 Tax=Euphydryas editha TaxID=104508 RepID=A0AAU9U1Q5_EUPED|nr:unnamed protein product [Euphydryas editha]
MNIPMAQQIELSNQNHSVKSTINSVAHIQMEKQNILSNPNAGNKAATSGFNSNNNMRPMGGMGRQIINMFRENQISKPNNMLQQAKPVTLPTCTHRIIMNILLLLDSLKIRIILYINRINL